MPSPTYNFNWIVTDEIVPKGNIKETRDIAINFDNVAEMTFSEIEPEYINPGPPPDPPVSVGLYYQLVIKYTDSHTEIYKAGESSANATALQNLYNAFKTYDPNPSP